MARSPFESLGAGEIAQICASSGFAGLKEKLARSGEYGFCSRHETNDPDRKAKYGLHYVLLYSLIFPVLQLFQHASTLAAVTPGVKPEEEFELAFRGEARGTFSWLQCFISDQEDWCSGRGCPMCVTSSVLSSEPTIRATIASALLAGSRSTSCTSQPAIPALPDLSPILLPAIKTAVEEDSFWGPDYYSHLFSRAMKLCQGLRDLARQCQVMERSLESSDSCSSTPSSDGWGGGSNSSSVTSLRRATRAAITLQRSRLAERQLWLQSQVQELIEGVGVGR